MTGATALDVVLSIVLLIYAVSGFRMGFLVGSFSLAGFLAGGFLGMSLLPALLERWPWAVNHELASRLLLIAGVVALALVGQRLLVRLGARLRSLVTFGPARAVDAVLGAAASVLAVALLVWFVAGGLRGTTSSPLARAIGGSRVLQVIDSLVPPQAGNLFADFREMLEQEGFPRVFEGIGTEPITPAAPPGTGIAAAAPVVRASASVVQVSGVAEACGRGQEGSGWVVSRERVVTNAHVVAGVEQVSVQSTGMARPLRGRVVVFDPSRDLAVIAVPGLQLAVLPLGPDLPRGAEAVVAGFPLSGPLRLDPARVRDEVVAVGSDIYGQPGVRREVYSLFTRVEPGNSGGPLLTADGAVSGVIFAKSLDDDQTGYALTVDEARPVLTAAPGASTAVATGACTAD